MAAICPGTYPGDKNQENFGYSPDKAGPSGGIQVYHLGVSPLPFEVIYMHIYYADSSQNHASNLTVREKDRENRYRIPLVRTRCDIIRFGC